MNKPSKTYLLASTMGVALLFTACSSEPEDKRDRMQDRMEDVREDMREVDTSDREAFESDRQDILSDLRDLRSDINDDLEDSKKELADQSTEGEVRERHQRLVNELESQRKTVEDQIQKVENASVQEWDQIHQESRNALDQAGAYYEREGLERRRGQNTNNTDANNTNVEVDGPAVDINDRDNNARTND